MSTKGEEAAEYHPIDHRLRRDMAPPKTTLSRSATIRRIEGISSDSRGLLGKETDLPATGRTHRKQAAEVIVDIYLYLLHIYIDETDKGIHILAMKKILTEMKGPNEDA